MTLYVLALNRGIQEIIPEGYSVIGSHNYSLYYLQFLTYQWQFTFVLYFHSLLYCTPIYSWTIEQIDRDIVLLLKITQI